MAAYFTTEVEILGVTDTKTTETIEAGAQLVAINILYDSNSAAPSVNGNLELQAVDPLDATRIIRLHSGFSSADPGLQQVGMADQANNIGFQLNIFNDQTVSPESGSAITNDATRKHPVIVNQQLKALWTTGDAADRFIIQFLLLKP